MDHAERTKRIMEANLVQSCPVCKKKTSIVKDDGAGSGKWIGACGDSFYVFIFPSGRQNWTRQA